MHHQLPTNSQQERHTTRTSPGALLSVLLMSEALNVLFFLILFRPVRTSFFVRDQFRRSLRIPKLAASAILVMPCCCCCCCWCCWCWSCCAVFPSCCLPASASSDLRESWCSLEMWESLSGNCVGVRRRRCSECYIGVGEVMFVVQMGEGGSV